MDYAEPTPKLSIPYLCKGLGRAFVWRRKYRHGVKLAAWIVSLGLGAASVGVDPSLPQVLSVGRPLGQGASQRLPAQPRLIWKARFADTLDHGARVDPMGRTVVVTSSGLVAQLDHRGKQQWSLTLDSPPATPITLLPDGGRALVTLAQRLLVWDSRGNQRFELQLSTAQSALSLLALPDSSLVIGSGSHVYQVEPSGRLRVHAKVASSVGYLVPCGERIAVVLRTGEVVEWRIGAKPRPLGSLGSTPPLSPVCHQGKLLSVQSDGSLVELDLANGFRERRVSGKSELLGSPVVLGKRIHVFSRQGLLLRFDTQGNETLRIPLVRRFQQGALLMAGQQRLAFGAAELGVGFVGPKGEVSSIEGINCDMPRGLQSAGPGKLLVSCEGGTLWMFGDAKVKQERRKPVEAKTKSP